MVRVGDVPVVDEKDSERGVDEERLGLRRGRGSGRRVTDVADPDVPRELVHDPLAVEDVLDETVLLLLDEPVPVGRHHPGRVLASVLEHEEALIKLEGGHALRLVDPDDPALPSDVATRPLGFREDAPARRGTEAFRSPTKKESGEGEGGKKVRGGWRVSC